MYQYKCYCAWVGHEHNKKRGAQMDLYTHRLVHFVRDARLRRQRHKDGPNIRWAVSDPWYLTLVWAATDKAKCLAGKHVPKYALNNHCMNCGKGPFT
jgi:hypothetical protein